MRSTIHGVREEGIIAEVLGAEGLPEPLPEIQEAPQPVNIYLAFDVEAETEAEAQSLALNWLQLVLSGMPPSSIYVEAMCPMPL